MITIIDRPAMVELAGEFYGIAERDYQRRLGPQTK